jgi:hypothetical protein
MTSPAGGQVFGRPASAPGTDAAAVCRDRRSRHGRALTAAAELAAELAAAASAVLPTPFSRTTANANPPELPRASRYPRLQPPQLAVPPDEIGHRRRPRREHSLRG